MAKKMTGKELVAFCRSKIGTAYVFGMKGKVMTEANFQYLHNTYGRSKVPYSDHAKVGKVCVDCSGLISWACGVVLGSGQWMNRANVKKPIATLRQAPIGALVWMDGHIGVYSGMKNGVHHYIAADGSKYGVREVPISQNRFTHWLLVESVFDYEVEENEMVTKEKIEIFGKEVECEVIRKGGKVYPYIRDFGEKVGLKISNKGRMPVVEKK